MKQNSNTLFDSTLSIFSFKVSKLLITIISITLFISRVQLISANSQNKQEELSTSEYEEYLACVDLFKSLGTRENVFETPTIALTNFTNNLCIPMLDSLNNAIRPTICTYTSVFVVGYLQYAYEVGDDIEIWAQNYCEKVENQVNSKLQMINMLRSTEAMTEEFTEVCLDEINEGDNWWFDPIIPNEIILVGDMCEAYQDLFFELDEKELTTYNDAIVFGYTLTYQMIVNAGEELAFHKCVDSKMQVDPATYCRETMMPSLNMTLWTDKNKEVACEEAAVALEEYCTEEVIARLECYPCAFVIAHMFERYEHYALAALETTFRIISEQSAAALRHDEDDDFKADVEFEESSKKKKSVKIELPGVVKALENSQNS